MQLYSAHIAYPRDLIVIHRVNDVVAKRGSGESPEGGSSCAENWVCLFMQFLMGFFYLWSEFLFSLYGLESYFLSISQQALRK